jgi:hypothetical protein
MLKGDLYGLLFNESASEIITLAYFERQVS